MKKILLIFSVVFLAGCAKDVDFAAMEKQSAEEIYKQGEKAQAEKRYSDAAKIFEELEKQHPYSRLIANAQLAAGECFYKNKKYDEALSYFEIFVKTHPTHEKVPYALYMLGVINYEQMPIIERDQEVTVTALTYLEELTNRYPESKYAKEAQTKIKELRDQIAGREVYVARYYQQRINYAAAIGRLNSVIDNYSDTAHAPEAMLRLIECYIAMGFIDEATNVNKLLQAKYQNTNWATHARALLNQTK